MNIDTLAEQLRDPDPHVRVAALRILAMVEETRALEAIRWIYRNDPEPGVREVANWAGRLIWAAQQRGHSTQRAVEALFDRPLEPKHQELFLASMGRFDLRQAKTRETQQYAQEQLFQRQLSDALHGDSVIETVETEAAPLPLPPPVTPPPGQVRQGGTSHMLSDLDSLAALDDDALLDIGLTELFQE